MAQKKSNNAMDIGLAIAGLGALAAGVFLYGTDAGKKKRKEIKGWTLKMKGEVIEKLEDIKEINEEKYHAIVDPASKRYKAMKKVAPEDLEAVTGELKKSWKHIVKIAKTGKTSSKKSTPKKVAK